MKSTVLTSSLQFFIATVLLLTAATQCFALQENKIVSKEEAKTLGVELRSNPDGVNGTKVWLEFTPKDELKNFSHVDVEIRAGKKCLMFGQLQTSRPTPERVSVHFSTDADNLAAAVLTIVVHAGLTTIIGYQFPLKDFIDLQKVGLVPKESEQTLAIGRSDKSQELRPYRSDEGRCEFVTVGGRKPVTVSYQAGEGTSAAKGRLLCFDQPHCRCQVRYVDLPGAAVTLSLAEIASRYGFERWRKDGKLEGEGAVKAGSITGEAFRVNGLPTKNPPGHVAPHSFVKTRVFVAGKRAFIVSGSAPEDMKQDAELEARAFFDSFRIVGD